jgi:transposase InsO family protein
MLDNGPEMTSSARHEWAEQRGVKLSFIEPGKPNQDAFIESVNGRFREECLDQYWFTSLRQTQTAVDRVA